LVTFFWLSCTTAARTYAFRLAVECRALLLECCYRKALVAHKQTIEEVGPGALSSYISIDLERIVFVADTPTLLVQLPLYYVVGAVILWHEFGWIPTVFAIAVIVVSSLLLPLPAGFTRKAQEAWSQATDRRVRLVGRIALRPTISLILVTDVFGPELRPLTLALACQTDTRNRSGPSNSRV
jgi:hypothetical protein